MFNIKENIAWFTMFALTAMKRFCSLDENPKKVSDDEILTLVKSSFILAEKGIFDIKRDTAKLLQEEQEKDRKLFQNQ